MDAVRMFHQAESFCGAHAGRPVLHGQRLSAGVEHDPLSRWCADNRGEHRCRTAAEIPEGAGLGGIHQDIGSRPDLGDAGNDFALHQGRGGADADRIQGDAGLADDVGGPQGLLLTHQSFCPAVGLIRGFIGMPFVGKDPFQDDLFLTVNITGQLEQFVVCDDTRTVLADFQFDEHFDGRGCCGKNLSQLIDLIGVVHSQADGDFFGQGLDAFELGQADDLIGNENIRQAVGGHDLSLTDLGDGDAGGACFHLQAGEFRHAVRLRMGPQLYPVLHGFVLHEQQVVHHDIPVDQQGRGVDVFINRPYGCLHGIYLLPVISLPNVCRGK